MRKTLVDALVSCADAPSRSPAGRFLQGLSRDELEYIAGFLGACILESPAPRRGSRAQMAERIAEYQQGRLGAASISPDQEHKMILLLEFLCMGRLRQLSFPLGAGQA